MENPKLEVRHRFTSVWGLCRKFGSIKNIFAELFTLFSRSVLVAQRNWAEKTGFPYTLCLHIDAAFPTINILHQSATFVTTSEPTMTHHYHSKLMVYIRVHPGLYTHAMGMDKIIGLLLFTPGASTWWFQYRVCNTERPILTETPATKIWGHFLSLGECFVFPGFPSPVWLGRKANGSPKWGCRCVWLIRRTAELSGTV